MVSMYYLRVMCIHFLALCIFIFRQTQYLIIQLIGKRFRSSDHHTQNLW